MSNETLFDRQSSFAFGVPGKLGKSFDGLRIKFKIIKSSDSKPNKSVIQVYNLSKESRTLTEKKGLVFLLNAGYSETVETLFSGDIARAITELEGSDYVTTFECGDGEKAFQSSRLDKSYQEGADLKDVFNELIASFGKSLKDTSAIDSVKISNGVSLSGLSRSHMDDLTNKHGLEWSIQNDVVQIIKKKGSTKETAVLLSVDSGLIGIPKKKEDGSVDIVSLLQPKIKPGRIITLESKFLNGEFVCKTVTHSGDTHGQDWYSQIEAIKR